MQQCLETGSQILTNQQHYLKLWVLCMLQCALACFVCVLQGPKEEELDENEWWDKLEKLKVNNEQQEIVIKRNFGRRGAEVFEDFAYQLGLHL